MISVAHLILNTTIKTAIHAVPAHPHQAAMFFFPNAPPPDAGTPITTSIMALNTPTLNQIPPSYSYTWSRCPNQACLTPITSSPHSGHCWRLLHRSPTKIWFLRPSAWPFKTCHQIPPSTSPLRMEVVLFNYTFLTPGATHYVRWMSKAICCIKFFFRKDLQLTKEEFVS